MAGRLAIITLALVLVNNAASAQPGAAPTTPEALANAPFDKGFLADDVVSALQDQQTIQRATQVYLWALPALSMYGMKEGSEKVFGSGYNILPIFKDRLNAKTLITTPNSDVIYALGYLDLKKDGPMVIEVPPGLQGILDDFWQRPICSEGDIGGKAWCGDVGLAGPDKGKGGNYLVLPPDYKGAIPPGYMTFRSHTYGVFVFWRGFFKDPKQLDRPVKVMEQTKIYPLGKKDSAKPMVFPNASAKPADMLYPEDGTAFDMLNRFIQYEYVNPADKEMRGLAAALGIEKGKPFNPDAKMRYLLDIGAKTAFRYGHTLTYTGVKYYPNRQWLNPFPGGSPTFSEETANQPDYRTGFFIYAYATSPGMAVSMENAGAKYPNAFRDSNGNFLFGGNSYKLTLPKDIPAANFWSLTLYDPVTGSGLDNGQPFPSLSSMDKPVTNPDGTTDLYVGPTSPGAGKNWLRTIPDKGFFAILRLYSPEKAFFDQSWVPGDFVKLN